VFRQTRLLVPISGFLGCLVVGRDSSAWDSSHHSAPLLGQARERMHEKIVFSLRNFYHSLGKATKQNSPSFATHDRCISSAARTGAGTPPDQAPGTSHPMSQSKFGLPRRKLLSHCQSISSSHHEENQFYTSSIPIMAGINLTHYRPAMPFGNRKKYFRGSY